MEEEIQSYLDRRAEWVKAVEASALMGDLYNQQIAQERERLVAMIAAEGDMVVTFLRSR